MALGDRLKLLFSIKDTPHRLALAFALGIFIGMSPLLGVHTVMGILIAWIFRLNRIATIVGVYVTNPWTIIPIYSFSTWVGAKCLGMNRILPDIDWNHMTLSLLLENVRPLLMPFVAGTLLMGAISSVLGYIIIFRIAKRAHG